MNPDPQPGPVVTTHVYNTRNRITWVEDAEGCRLLVPIPPEGLQAEPEPGPEPAAFDFGNDPQQETKKSNGCRLFASGRPIERAKWGQIVWVGATRPRRARRMAGKAGRVDCGPDPGLSRSVTFGGLNDESRC